MRSFLAMIMVTGPLALGTTCVLCTRYLYYGAMSYRSENRAANALRPTKIIPDFIAMAEGSRLIEAGNTRVICTASIEETVPPCLRKNGKGWMTAEYPVLQ